MIELRGGPGDGKALDDLDDEVLSMHETCRTCEHPEHVEVRIHIYMPDGSYRGCSHWFLRNHFELPPKRSDV